MLEVDSRGPQPLHVRRKDLALAFVSAQVADDFAVTKHTHGDDDETNAVGQLRHVKTEARHTRVDVGAHQPQQQAEQNHANGFEQRARRQHHGTNQAQDHQ